MIYSKFLCSKLLFIGVFVPLQLHAMDNKDKGKVIYLDQLEKKTAEQLKDAEKNWKSLPQSWYEDHGTHDSWKTSEKVAEKELRYNKLKEINFYQYAKQSPGIQQYLEYKKKEEGGGNSTRIDLTKGLLPMGAANIAMQASLYKPAEQFVKKDDKDNQNKAQPFDPLKSSVFKEFKRRNKTVDKLSQFYDGFNNELMKAQSEEVKNAHRDAFIRGATTTAVGLGIGTLGVPVATAVQGVSALDDVIPDAKKKMKEYNAKAVCTPAADAFYALYTGSTCKEALKSGEVTLEAVEVFNATKRKVAEFISDGLIAGADKIKLTEENIKKISAFVHKSVTETAPAYIQESYAKLLATKEITTKENEENSAFKKRIKWKQEKALLDKGVKNNPKEIDALIEQVLKEEQGKIDQIFVRNVQAVQTQEKKLEQYRERAKVLDTMENTFNGVAAIATIFGKTRESYAIATFGISVAQIGSGVNALMQNGLAAGINPYVGILMGVASLCSLFQEDERQDNTQVILDAISQGVMHLSQQMHRLHEDMRYQFEQSRKQLNAHHLIMLEQFFAMRQDNKMAVQKLKELGKYIQENKQVIQDGINSLHATANSNFKMTMSNLNGLRIEEIDDLVERSLLMLQRKDVSEQEFNRCIEELYVKAVSRASADALTGGAVDIHDKNALATMLDGASTKQNVFAHPAFSNINLLSRYLDANSKNFKHEKLVNPLIWVKCVEAFLNAIDQKLNQDTAYPSTQQVKDLDIQKLIVLQQHGQKIIATIEKMYKNKSVEEIATKYQQHMQELVRALEQEQKNFEQVHAQQLCKEHSAFIENENAKKPSILNSYECKKCVEHIEKSINISRAIQSVHTMPNTNITCHSYLKNQLKYNLHIEDSKTVTAQDVRSASQFFEKSYQSYSQALAAPNALLLNTITDLSKNVFEPVGNGASRWLYPGSQESNLPILMLPSQNLSFDPVYVVAENKELGKISHEYSIIGKTMHMQSYFIDKNTAQKIKILHLCKECSFDDMYSLSENILHFWYGGRYPKSTDTYTGPGKASGSMERWVCAGTYPLAADSFSSYYPPITPYAAERDIFVTTARKEQDQSLQYKSFVQERIQADQAEKRMALSKELMGQLASRSAMSAIFKAAQELDVYFKVLDCLLTVLYSDFINDNCNKIHQQLMAIKADNDASYLKDITSINQYLQSHSGKNNPDNKKGYLLPGCLQYTTQKIAKAVKEIIAANEKPQLRCVTNVIDSINGLVNKYQQRRIIPQVLPLKVPDNELLVLVLKQNEELTRSNKELAIETKEVKQELAEVKEQLKTMMNLLLKSNAK